MMRSTELAKRLNKRHCTIVRRIERCPDLIDNGRHFHKLILDNGKYEYIVTHDGVYYILIQLKKVKGILELVAEVLEEFDRIDKEEIKRQEEIVASFKKMVKNRHEGKTYEHHSAKIRNKYCNNKPKRCYSV